MADRFEAKLERAERKERKALRRVEAEARGEIHSGTSMEAGGGEKEETAADGMEKMRTAADKTIGRECKNIVDALLHKTFDGDSRCARLLFWLGEPQKEGKGKKRRFPSVAKMLAAEPQWPGEIPDEDKETGAGDQGIGNRE